MYETYYYYIDSYNEQKAFVKYELENYKEAKKLTK